MDLITKSYCFVLFVFEQNNPPPNSVLRVNLHTFLLGTHVGKIFNMGYLPQTPAQTKLCPCHWKMVHTFRFALRHVGTCATAAKGTTRRLGVQQQHPGKVGCLAEVATASLYLSSIGRLTLRRLQFATVMCMDSLKSGHQVALKKRND